MKDFLGTMDGLGFAVFTMDEGDREPKPLNDTIYIEGHGYCEIVQEHGREWAACPDCGAQWALDGSNTEQVSEGDGYCTQKGESK